MKRLVAIKLGLFLCAGASSETLVTLRTYEIGIRIALGARPSDAL